MRLQNIDFLRGLAVSMVVLVHSTSSTLPWIEESILHKVFEFGKYGVEIFFVISGYIICYSLYNHNYSFKKSFNFLLRRIIRINPPAYIILIFYLLIEVFVFALNGRYLILSQPFETNQVISNFLFLTNAFNTDLYLETFWTLETELQFYLFIAFTFPLIINKIELIRYISLAGLIIFGFLDTPFALSVHFACFLLGIIYFMMQNNMINKKIFMISLIPCVSTFLLNGQYFELLFSLFSLFVLFVNEPIKSKVFQFLGRISFSLYIVHIFVFIYLDVILNKIGWNFLHETITSKFLLVIIYYGIAILISTIFYEFVEKPFINYSKRISMN